MGKEKYETRRARETDSVLPILYVWGAIGFAIRALALKMQLPAKVKNGKIENAALALHLLASIGFEGECIEFFKSEA
jgi:hypothetical protein